MNTASMRFDGTMGRRACFCRDCNPHTDDSVVHSPIHIMMLTASWCLEEVFALRLHFAVLGAHTESCQHMLVCHGGQHALACSVAKLPHSRLALIHAERWSCAIGDPTQQDLACIMRQQRKSALAPLGPGRSTRNALRQ